MKTFQSRFTQLYLFLFLAIGSGAAFGNELSTSYTWGSVTYPSLQGAEEALRKENFIGAAYYTYQYSWNNGRLRKYDHPPTTEYFDDQKLVFSSMPGIACDNSPLYDRFGNDRID